MFKVMAGDFKKGVTGTFIPRKKQFRMPTGYFMGKRYETTMIKQFEEVNEENARTVLGTVGWTVAGAATLGIAGLVAGAVCSGGTKVTFMIQFADGKKALCETKRKYFNEMRAGMFA